MGDHHEAAPPAVIFGGWDTMPHGAVGRPMRKRNPQPPCDI
jgi:hypothetical protein